MKVIGVCGQAGSGKNTVGDMIECHVDTKQMALADPMKQFAKRVFGFTDTQLWGDSDQRNAPDYRYGRKGWRKLFRSWYAVDDLHQHVKTQLENIQTFDWLVDLFPDASAYEINKAWSHLITWGRDLLKQAKLDGYLTPRKVLQTLGTEWGRDYSKDVWIDYTLRKAGERLKDNLLLDYVVVTDVRFMNEAKKIREVGGHVWRVTRPGADGSYANNAGVTNHRSERDQHSDEMKQYVSKEIINDGTLEDLDGKVSAAIDWCYEEDYAGGDVSSSR